MCTSFTLKWRSFAVHLSRLTTRRSELYSQGNDCRSSGHRHSEDRNVCIKQDMGACKHACMHPENSMPGAAWPAQRCQDARPGHRRSHNPSRRARCRPPARPRAAGPNRWPSRRHPPLLRACTKHSSTVLKHLPHRHLTNHPDVDLHKCACKGACTWARMYTDNARTAQQKRCMLPG